MESVDVTDSKSVGGNIVWVRVPPPAPYITNPKSLENPRLSGFSFDFPMFFAAYAVRNFNIVLSKAAKRYNLKDVSDRAAQEIERITGINVKGNKTAIEKRMIEHIFIRHGKKGKEK